MANMRELKGRIESVHSSQKITGAMKMISSARLRKAENKLFQSAPYQEKLREIWERIVESGCDYVSPLMMQRAPKKADLVIFASDDGLCGSFNITLYKKMLERVADLRKQGVTSFTVYPFGKKIYHDVNRIPGIKVEEPSALFIGKKYTDATKEVADRVMERFVARETDRVEIISFHYKSLGSQMVESRQFLPLEISQNHDGKGDGTESWYIFEPDCRKILDMLYPLMLHAGMYEAYLGNATSEQAARILAMQTANDNANKLLGNLHLEYNKLRQQGITSELLDIAGGMTRET